MTCVIDISLLQFGQISVVGTPEYARLTLMTLPFARQNVGASKNAHPALGACQSEKLELELARSPCDSGSITKYCAPVIYKSREERYDSRRMGD